MNPIAEASGFAAVLLTAAVFVTACSLAYVRISQVHLEWWKAKHPHPPLPRTETHVSDRMKSPSRQCADGRYSRRGDRRLDAPRRSDLYPVKLNPRARARAFWLHLDELHQSVVSPPANVPLKLHPQAATRSKVERVFRRV